MGRAKVWLHSVVVEGKQGCVVACTSRLEMSRATGSKVLVNSRAYCVMKGGGEAAPSTRSHTGASDKTITPSTAKHSQAQHSHSQAKQLGVTRHTSTQQTKASPVAHLARRASCCDHPPCPGTATLVYSHALPQRTRCALPCVSLAWTQTLSRWCLQLAPVFAPTGT